jgi:hypothetical protein
MLARPDRLPRGDYGFEVKWDGFRAIVATEDGLQVRSRRGWNMTDLVPENCAPSYPDECIPPPTPDLNCKDIPYRNFRVLWDVPDPDPHHFDGDHDGIGCET